MATCAVENRPPEELVVQKLNELFGNILNIDVIKTVAVSCQYDVTESSNKLLEITSFSDRSITKMESTSTAVVEAITKCRNVPAVTGSTTRCSRLTTSTSLNNIQHKKSKKKLDYERTVDYIQKGYKVLVIMRGVPGCGKSYLAKRVLESTIGFDNNYHLHILSTDDYFSQNGAYQYDSSKLSEAHGWNHNRAFQALSRGFSPIIIDNTNTQMWEMKPYAMMATDYGYIIEILEPDTHWCSNDRELVKRNTHGVTKAKIRDMLDRYEKNVTPQKLLCAYNLTYRLQKPPQFRLYPPLHLTNSTLVDSFGQNRAHSKCDNLKVGGGIHKSKSAAILNPLVSEFKIDSRETINLMDFNDEEAVNVNSLPVTELNEINSSSEQNLVDRILMCSNDIPENSNLLQPLQETVSDVITIDSSDDESQMAKNSKKLFPDLETAWGINENALRSWDIVTPLKDESNKILSSEPTEVPSVITRDFSCYTEEEYFRLLRNKEYTCNGKDYIVLTTVNRDINHGTPKKSPIVLKKAMLDKSCLTEDIYDNYENHMSHLVSLFPSVSQNHLKYWYTKYKGDLEWTIEFILESQGEVSALLEDSDVDGKKADEMSCNIDSDSSNSKQKKIVDFKENKVNRNKRSSENDDLKKVIESKIDINAQHYSKHLLKVKQFKFGCKDVSDDTKPSTSKGLIDQTCNDTNPELIDSDTEFDEEFVKNFEKMEEKSEEIVELNLGDYFVNQLESKFGNPDMIYPKGFQPVVQVPVTIARQLYTFYIESICQQMENQKQVLETLVKEDEEFARKLQAKEEQEILEVKKPIPNFKEIIEEQVAQSFYQKEVDKWKELNPDNLAAMLTRQKLFSIFPFIDRNTLLEILYAHGNKYQDTVETLLASTGTSNILENMDLIKEPPLKDDVIEEMKEAQKLCASENYDEQRKAKSYREEANRYLNKRTELYQKAQQYHQRGMREVAQFYSTLASQQTSYYDRANSMAATAFLDEHSKRLQDFNTIDLHFLYVKEAIPALDVFLDRNINLLKLSNNRQSDYLQIITGRGKNSENGISKIRPAVMARLKQRNIKFAQLNPGLLKARITKASLVTSEC